jgi:hypothetical protein
VARDPDGNGAFWSKVQNEELPHCGLCDPATRHVELDDGRVSRCPRCHPLQDQLLPQTWRCPSCRALIFRTERGLPCGVHRTVAATHREYDEAQSGAVPLLPNPVTDAGAKSARAQLAEREGQADEPDPAEAEEAAPAEDDYPF